MISRVLIASFALYLVTAQDPPSKIIYGTDDRIEYYESSAAVKAIVSESIVALLANHEHLSCNDTACDWLISSSNSLCSDERFSDQPMFAQCSGTLVDTNKIVTAGHCLDTTADCDSMLILFNFHYTSAGVMQTLTPDDKYRCKAYYQYEQTNINGEFVDYMVVVLDRDVSSDKVPMVMATSADTKPAENTMLTLAGYPSGLPMKALQDAVQYNAADRPNFDAWYSDCDTFGGNSGSGVFDVANRKLWGILSSGNTDYVIDSELSCRRPNTVTDSSQYGGIGEIICYPFPANDLLPTCTDCSGISVASCVDGFCSTYSSDGSGSGDSGSGTSTTYSCNDARALWALSPSCCMPVENDGSSLCTAYLQVYTNCDHQYFGMTSANKTCPDNLLYGSDDCVVSNTYACNCGPFACGVRSPATVATLALPLFVLAALVSWL